MKKIILTLLCALVFWTPVANAQMKNKDAIDFVEALADEIITNVLKSKDTADAKMERFEKYFLKALDTQTIGKFVLGRYWKTATHTDQEKFLDAFTDMALKSWAAKFDMYTGQDIVFVDARPAEGNNQVYVSSQIKHDPNPVEVIWRVEYKNNEYKIIDIIIEGVSMDLSYRNEYTSYLQNHTLEELTKKLREQTSNIQKNRSGK